MKEQWKRFRDDPPGERFRLRYERRKQQRPTPLARIAWTIVALLLVVVGLVAIPLPGPGFIIVGLGVAILAEESLTLAKACDRFEVFLRKLLRGLRKAPAKSSRP